MSEGLLVRATATATRLIAKYGEPCTWQSTSDPTVPDATKPFITVDGVTTPHTIPILFVTDSSNPLMKLLAATSVETTGRKAIMAASSAFVPKLSDVVVRSDATKLALNSVDPVAPNGVPILWKLVFKA